MSRVKKINHKGKNRMFTNPEELEKQKDFEEKETWQTYRNQNKPLSNGKYYIAKEPFDDDKIEIGIDWVSGSNTKRKGVDGLIPIDNPNRKQWLPLEKYSNAQYLQSYLRKSDKPKPSKVAKSDNKNVEELNEILEKLSLVKGKHDDAPKKKNIGKKGREMKKIHKVRMSRKGFINKRY